MPNHLCLLPNTALGVTVWDAHPCGGWYMVEAWCYGAHGRIGYWRDVPLAVGVRHEPDAGRNPAETGGPHGR